MKHGEWKFFDKNEKLESLTEYEKGKPVKYSVIKNGSLSSIPEKEWPFYIKNSIQSEPEGSKEYQKMGK